MVQLNQIKLRSTTLAAFNVKYHFGDYEYTGNVPVNNKIWIKIK